MATIKYDIIKGVIDLVKNISNLSNVLISGSESDDQDQIVVTTFNLPTRQEPVRTFGNVDTIHNMGVLFVAFNQDSLIANDWLEIIRENIDYTDSTYTNFKIFNIDFEYPITDISLGEQFDDYNRSIKAIGCRVEYIITG